MDKKTKIIIELLVLLIIILSTILICKVIFEPKVIVQMSGAKLYYDENGEVMQTENDYSVQNIKLIDGIPDQIKKINVNTASKEELISIPAIGDKMAERIIEYRKKSPFKTVEELKNIEGIGDKTLEKIIEYIKID